MEGWAVAKDEAKAVAYLRLAARRDHAARGRVTGVAGIIGGIGGAVGANQRSLGFGAPVPRVDGRCDDDRGGVLEDIADVHQHVDARKDEGVVLAWRREERDEE